jgi:hypothetical protein
MAMPERARLYVDSSRASHDILEQVKLSPDFGTIDVVHLGDAEAKRQRVTLPCLLFGGTLVGASGIKAYLHL